MNEIMLERWSVLVITIVDFCFLVYVLLVVTWFWCLVWKKNVNTGTGRIRLRKQNLACPSLFHPSLDSSPLL